MWCQLGYSGYSLRIVRIASGSRRKFCGSQIRACEWGYKCICRFVNTDTPSLKEPGHRDTLESLADERDLHTPIRMDFNVFYVKERPTIIPARALVFVQTKTLRLLRCRYIDSRVLRQDDSTTTVRAKLAIGSARVQSGYVLWRRAFVPTLAFANILERCQDSGITCEHCAVLTKMPCS
jgi:hypothetical protein